MEIPKLGIIAAVQLDGSVSFYPVPHPKFLMSQKSIPGQPVYRNVSQRFVIVFTLAYFSDVCMYSPSPKTPCSPYHP